MVGILCSSGLAADKKPYSAFATEKAEKKWRFGYYEGGFYKDYPRILKATVNGLIELGWIYPITIPKEIENNTNKMWAWLAYNAQSKYIEFVADGFYTLNWRNEIREHTKQTIIKRLNEQKDIDLMIAMGTWAGQDLANNQHSITTIVSSVADAVASKIIPSTEDSGFDHVYALVDPKRYIRQIYAFHSIMGFKFKKLGVIYIDSIAGRSYAAIEDIRKIGKERNFEVVECLIPEESVTTETKSKLIECAKTLSPKIDAFYMTIMAKLDNETLPEIVSIMNQAKIPVFSQAGSDEVRQGALLSISSETSRIANGRCCADAIGKVMNGAKPRELDQVCEVPVKLAFNKATAKAIGLRDDLYQLLSNTAQEIYETIEEVK